MVFKFYFIIVIYKIRFSNIYILYLIIPLIIISLSLIIEKIDPVAKIFYLKITGKTEQIGCFVDFFILMSLYD